MTIQIIFDQIKIAKSKWKSNVVDGRPSEDAVLKMHLGATASYPSVSSQIEGWQIQIGKVSGPRVSRSLPKSLIASTSLALGSFNRCLDHAGNGVDWLITNAGLGNSLALVDHLISELTKDSAREQTEILDAAQIRLSTDLKSAQDGSEAAKEFQLKWPALQEQIAQVEASTASIAEKIEEVAETAIEAKSTVGDQVKSAIDQISTDRANISEAKSSFDDALVQARSNMNEAGDLKSTAAKLVAEISKQWLDAAKGLADASEALNKATTQQNATRDRLTLALRDAQMEGLAGSFTRMTEKTGDSIKSEQKRFDISLTYLAIIGFGALMIELNYGFPKNIEEFSFRLARVLSLAAPGIWIAWIASRKLSALNRVFSDYQYKSAAALAYESYRQTVAEAGSDELKQQLLAFAIHSFGENPTRYYDAAKNEPASPAESWLDRIPFFNKPSKSVSTRAPDR